MDEDVVDVGVGVDESVVVEGSAEDVVVVVDVELVVAGSLVVVVLDVELVVVVDEVVVEPPDVEDEVDAVDVEFE